MPTTRTKLFLILAAFGTGLVSISCRDANSVTQSASVRSTKDLDWLDSWADGEQKGREAAIAGFSGKIPFPKILGEETVRDVGLRYYPTNTKFVTSAWDKAFFSSVLTELQKHPETGKSSRPSTRNSK